MSDLLTITTLFLVFASSILTGTPTTKPTITPTAPTCTIQTTIGCLDDAEITNYNVVNNDGSICKVEIFGVCTDGMNQQELEDLAIYHTQNNN